MGSIVHLVRFFHVCSMQTANYIQYFSPFYSKSLVLTNTGYKKGYLTPECIITCRFIIERVSGWLSCVYCHAEYTQGTFEE
jgi:hypothetical protein